MTAFVSWGGAARVDQELFQAIRSWLPLLFTLGVFSLLIGSLRRLFRRRQAAGSGSAYREQAVLAVMGLAFVLALTITAPIGDTLRGQLLGLIGIILSATIALSSTTIMGNLIGGLMLRVVSNLGPGDFVRSGEHFGRITEKGLLHVEIQTEDSDLVTLPNLQLVQQPFTLIRAEGTIIWAEVSLGYDINRLDIDAALLKAAAEAGLTDAFVQVRNLGDFSVVYRLCGRLSDVRQIVSRRARLRAAMLDALHAADIEIVSPTFMNQRQIAREVRFIPGEHREGLRDAGQSLQDIEDLLFDKAERVLLLERLRQRLQSQRLRIAEQEKRIEQIDGSDAAAAATARQRLAHLRRREEQLKALIRASEDRDQD